MEDTLHLIARWSTRGLIIATPLVVAFLAYYASRNRAAAVATKQLPWWVTLIVCTVLVVGTVAIIKAIVT